MKKTKQKEIIYPILCVIMIICTIVCSVVVFSPATEDANAATVIKKGSTGDMVKTIQQKLKNWGYYTGNVDGIFGSITESAVKYFQRTNNLYADGIVGSKTAAAMGINLSSSSTSSSNDTYLLARLVYAEARGEPYTGQVAVASVVLNRVKSSSFPNTISGVIYQSGAFTVVSDGQINLTPNDTAQRAAKDAMSGWDPTSGCTFYYNPNTATSAWIRSRPIMLQIANHTFCL
ncbi:MAG: spore cortex-lytic enzyme [Clostridia bacterium]